MKYHGRVKNGVVILDGQSSIPEGTEVAVEPLDGRQDKHAQPVQTGHSTLFDAWKRAKPTGIRDLAINHDHYIYGHPKVEQ